jgi:hypothetical protein
LVCRVSGNTCNFIFGLIEIGANCIQFISLMCEIYNDEWSNCINTVIIMHKHAPKKTSTYIHQDNNRVPIKHKILFSSFEGCKCKNWLYYFYFFVAMGMHLTTTEICERITFLKWLGMGTCDSLVTVSHFYFIIFFYFSHIYCLIGFNNDVFLKILQQIQKRNFSELTNEILIKKKNPHKLQTFKVIHKDWSTVDICSSLNHVIVNSNLTNGRSINKYPC